MKIMPFIRSNCSVQKLALLVLLEYFTIMSSLQPFPNFLDFHTYTFNHPSNFFIIYGNIFIFFFIGLITNNEIMKSYLIVRYKNNRFQLNFHYLLDSIKLVLLFTIFSLILATLLWLICSLPYQKNFTQLYVDSSFNHINSPLIILIPHFLMLLYFIFLSVVTLITSNFTNKPYLQIIPAIIVNCILMGLSSLSFETVNFISNFFFLKTIYAQNGFTLSQVPFVITMWILIIVSLLLVQYLLISSKKMYSFKFKEFFIFTNMKLLLIPNILVDLGCISMAYSWSNTSFGFNKFATIDTFNLTSISLFTLLPVFMTYQFMKILKSYQEQFGLFIKTRKKTESMCGLVLTTLMKTLLLQITLFISTSLLINRIVLQQSLPIHVLLPYCIFLFALTSLTCTMSIYIRHSYLIVGCSLFFILFCSMNSPNLFFISVTTLIICMLINLVTIHINKKRRKTIYVM